ncbi:subtype B tannase [Thiothrix subterranea]|uniref:Subtype B tannase n=1 Tax=Thiothrix subterranea TaxID=2735563 RepID=A0AA51MLU9_9GAMM|nr:subtype B tannase [Thiothrix subterranea]MDQ5769297.1 subtype B tannase [Thiothrix subterranea]WML86280.1 subtype B tannase [Thiothrix subterranea]
MQRKIKHPLLASTLMAITTAGLLSGCGGSSNNSTVVTTPNITSTTDAEDAALKFDANNYTTVTVTVDGVATAIRQYRVVYVDKPIKMAATQPTLMGTTATLSDPYVYQTMIISVPEAVINNQKTALYFAVNNAGWFASPVSTTIAEGKAFVSTNDTDNIGAALKAGYVVVNVGTRSRGIKSEDGRWVGKAPAPVVDAKAAIRYLRLNDSNMPGSAERIIMTGTSGGGGLTAAVSASGNSADYLPFLVDIGAAGIQVSGTTTTSTLKDGVFAAVAYCPINNLGNADTGYEWEYNAIRNDTNTPALNGVAYSAGEQISASTALAAAFPAYVNGLGLKRDNGTALTDANLRDTTLVQVKAEIERQLAAGKTIPALGENFTLTQSGPPGTAPTTKTLVNDWLTLNGSGSSATVANIDYTKFLTFVTTLKTLKTVVAFDAVGVTGNKDTSGSWKISGETNLFGSDSNQYSNFNAWSWNNNAANGDASGSDDTGLSWSAYLSNPSNNLATQIKLINPLAYLNTSADSAPYWYVRHGMVDRDTAFAMQTLLYQAVKNDPTVKDINFKLPYLVGHSGNYDVQEAFTWIKAKLDATP